MTSPPTGPVEIWGADTTAPPPPSPLLVSNDTSRTDTPTRVRWSQSQCKCYHRVRSLFTLWASHGYQLVWVMLSTAPGGEADKLSQHHKRLRQNLDRKLGFTGVQFFQVRTTEGYGVLHVVWAWQGDRPFFVKQNWLSNEWERIHGAPVVWVKRIGDGQQDREKVGRYIVDQNCGAGSFVRFSWSWWSLEMPLVKCWNSLKDNASVTFLDPTARWGRRREFIFPKREVVAAWEDLLRFGRAKLGDISLAIQGNEIVEVSCLPQGSQDFHKTSKSRPGLLTPQGAA